MDKSKYAKTTIEKNLYCVISTSKDNKPWVTPIYFGFDDAYSFYWLSAFDAVHSQNIRANKDVAIAIYDSHDDFGTSFPGKAVYTISTAEEINDAASLEKIFTFFFKRVPKDIRKTIEPGLKPKKYLNNSPRRFYKATHKKIFILDKAEEVNGHHLDKRTEVKLKLKSTSNLPSI